jgi:small subunit ribosomal protein S18
MGRLSHWLYEITNLYLIWGVRHNPSAGRTNICEAFAGDQIIGPSKFQAVSRQPWHPILGIFSQLTIMRFANRRFKSKSSQESPVIAIVQKRSRPKSPTFQGTIDYKNIVLLRKFITAEGKILPRRSSQLTAKQQRYMARAIKNARIMGLLPFINKNQPSAT